MSKRKICLYPFKCAELHPNGDVFFCWCKPFIVYNYSLGNIFQQDFDEIWNGEKAQTFRQDIIDGKYTYCDLDMCSFDNDMDCYTENPDEVNIISDYPEKVNFCMDDSCNLQCIFCRDKMKCNEQETVEKLDSLIDNKLLPMLKNAKQVEPDTGGEIFVSKHSKKLVKAIIKNYPNIKLEIFTNGTYCDEKHFKELNLFGHIESIQISVHAATKDIYNKIVHGGNFNKVMKNIKWIARQKIYGNIEEIKLNFCVNSINYKDMVKFAQLAKKLNLIAEFWEVRGFDSIAVVEEDHPNHNELVEILKDPIFNSQWVMMNNKLRNLCPEETEEQKLQRIKEEEKYLQSPKMKLRKLFFDFIKPFNRFFYG